MVYLVTGKEKLLFSCYNFFAILNDSEKWQQKDVKQAICAKVYFMKIFLVKDVQNVGLAGEIITVADGFATNYLLPHKLGIQVTSSNEAEFSKRLQKVEQRQEVIKSKTSMLAERIKSVQVVIKRKMHDDGLLYGSINPQDIADELAKQGISVSKSQVLIEKSIKAKGTYQVTVKLSSTLLPVLTVKILPEVG